MAAPSLPCSLLHKHVFILLFPPDPFLFSHPHRHYCFGALITIAQVLHFPFLKLSLSALVATHYTFYPILLKSPPLL